MTDYRRLAAITRAELNRADLTERQGCVAEVLVKATFGRSRATVRIPRLEDFGAAIGYTKSHVHAALFGVKAGETRTGGLVTARIVLFEKLHDGGAEYRLLPDARQWAVGWRYEQSQLRTFLHGLDLITGQVQGELLDPEPDLDRALADNSVEQALAPFLNQERSPFPNREPVWSPVPDLGTSPVQSSVTVHSKTAFKQSNSVQLTAGTAFSVNEADVYNRLEAFVGVEDMNQWGGDWRKNWIRKHPAAFAQALKILEDEAKNGWRARTSRGAALKDLTRRLAK